ncbi:hypothetical protein LZ554_008389 [Drepanopeziza brunnea f. sp. 'monogermtubi']|nr:hypothetical protein LZ554_008389 [Drepanopeziza brunnea f. sp. 'monogermtubi']
MLVFGDRAELRVKRNFLHRVYGRSVQASASAVIVSRACTRAFASLPRRSAPSRPCLQIYKSTKKNPGPVMATLAPRKPAVLPKMMLFDKMAITKLQLLGLAAGIENATTLSKPDLVDRLTRYRIQDTFEIACTIPLDRSDPDGAGVAKVQREARRRIERYDMQYRDCINEYKKEVMTGRAAWRAREKRKMAEYLAEDVKHFSQQPKKESISTSESDESKKELSMTDGPGFSFGPPINLDKRNLRAERKARSKSGKVYKPC